MKLILTLCVGLALSAGAADRPNIVLILADDMGYGDCVATHPASEISTPHIDQLAREGVLFTDAHAASGTCTPSRYGLLTGINPARTGVVNTLLRRGEPIIAEDETTIATMLRDHGYATRMVGKWHLGFATGRSNSGGKVDYTQPLMGGPIDRGFDTFFGMASSPGSSPLCFIRDRRVEVLPTERGLVTLDRGRMGTTEAAVMQSPGFLPEAVSPSFCKEAVSIIHEQAAAKNPKPLFLYYASPVPHQPWVPTKAFKGKSGLGDYGDFVMQLDDVVGRINRALKETGLADNTLLIFTSDNGPGPWAVKAMAKVGHAASGGLRGHKAQVWEGGHRVPFVVKWPAKIPEGTVSNATINGTDLFATLASMLGIDAAKTYPGSAPDSVSFWARLLNPEEPHIRPPMIHRQGIRHGDWKLAHPKRYQQGEPVAVFQLYDLGDDRAEERDVSENHSERASELFETYRRFMNGRTLK